MKEKKHNFARRSLDLYRSRNRQNLVIVTVAFLIALSSVYYTRVLVRELKNREQWLIELYAKTLEYTFSEPNTADLTFVVQQIMVPNNSIPVILTDREGRPIDSKNIRFDPNAPEEVRVRILRDELEKMRKEHDPILITFRDEYGEVSDFQYVYYKNSLLLSRLEFYPHVQLSIIAVFVIIAFITFNYSKEAEQNSLWVGLAKETAHQLGTPISSLMAWTEYFRQEKRLDEDIIAEIEKDIHRLETITARFSNIGSAPTLYHENISQAIETTVNYLRKRISKKVEIQVSAFPHDIRARINKPLFEWVIENLCKNAVDSMGGVGRIDIDIRRGLDDKVIVDITDSGKGIPKSKVKNVFSPGYSTKTRGWGLGLTLVKRIVENYHEGRIYVKQTEIDKGTTFRILLRS